MGLSSQGDILEAVLSDTRKTMPLSIKTRGSKGDALHMSHNTRALKRGLSLSKGLRVEDLVKHPQKLMIRTVEAMNPKD